MDVTLQWEHKYLFYVSFIIYLHCCNFQQLIYYFYTDHFFNADHFFNKAFPIYTTTEHGESFSLFIYEIVPLE
jgi:hypothetical protein